MSVTITEEIKDKGWMDGEQTDGGTLIGIMASWSVEEEEEAQEFTKVDFERDLRKVSRRRNIPFGENIRDAIQSIKGK